MRSLDSSVELNLISVTCVVDKAKAITFVLGNFFHFRFDQFSAFVYFTIKLIAHCLVKAEMNEFKRLLYI